MARFRLDIKRFAGVALLLILLFGALIWGCLYFFQKKETKEDAYVVYTALFEVEPSLAEQLCVGQVLIDARGKEAAGEILKVTRESALCEDAYGVFSLPEKTLVCLTLGGNGRRTAEGAKIGSLTPRAGEAVYLYGSVRLEGLCVRVRAL